MSGILQMFLGKGNAGLPPMTGLIAYWKFANGADTADYNFKYNLTKTGTPTIGTDRLGNTAGFSGFSTSNYFYHPTFLDAGLTAWTFFVWCKPTTGTGEQFLVDKTASNTQYPFELSMKGGKLILTFQAPAVFGANVCTSSTSINTGNRTFCVISGDSSGRASVKMNINGGSSEGTITGNGTNSGAIGANSSYDFRIGGRGDGNVNTWLGSIGEVGFCNRVLTEAEKLRLYTESASQYIVPNILIP